jgi:large subunit ribosomal protein L17
MRHKKKFNHLGRKRGHRKAMLSNMASSLIMHKRIQTTTAKAKALRIFVEPLITKAKDDTTHSRRHVFSNLQDKEATNELFRDVVVKVGERPGGYTRIIKLGKRLGDNADMCIIELVDFNENLLAEKAAAKSSRRRRGSKKKSQASETEVADASPAVEEATDQVISDAGSTEEEKETVEVKAEETVEDLSEEEPKAEVKEEAPEAMTEESTSTEVADDKSDSAEAADKEDKKEE